MAANGKVYLANEDGQVLVLKAGPVFEVLATNDMGAPVLATPAISDGRLLVRTASHLIAIGALTPAAVSRWRPARTGSRRTTARPRPSPRTFGLAASMTKYSSGAWAPLPWPRPKWAAASFSGSPVKT